MCFGILSHVHVIRRRPQCAPTLMSTVSVQIIMLCTPYDPHGLSFWVGNTFLAACAVRCVGMRSINIRDVSRVTDV